MQDDERTVDLDRPVRLLHYALRMGHLPLSQETLNAPQGTWRARGKVEKRGGNELMEGRENDGDRYQERRK